MGVALGVVHYAAVLLPDAESFSRSFCVLSHQDTLVQERFAKFFKWQRLESNQRSSGYEPELNPILPASGG